VKARKHRPDWDSGFFMQRTDPEWKPAPRRKSGKLPDVPFSFDFEACRRAWANVGVIVDEGRIRLHIVELMQRKKRLKKR
jgi:hypothetical protein